MSRVRAEYIRGVVCGHVVVYGVIHSCQKWSIPHITLMEWYGTISIPASSSLDHYTTDMRIMVQEALGSSNIQGNS
jgi:hypothetical protein